jgi:hypothetical protein
LHDKLSNLGYKTFFDVESLRSGQFNTKLFDVIDECKDFVVILSPNSLDRCENEQDWVRFEIAHALKKKKNVIPVLLRGFKFPDTLPEDIEPLRYQSGIEASTEFFDAFAKRLMDFLVSKPKLVNRVLQNSFSRKIIPMAIALFLALAVLLGVVKLYNRTQASFPYTVTEKNLVSEVIYYISQNYGYVNVSMSEYSDAIKSFENYLQEPTALNLTTLKSDIEYRKKKIESSQKNFVKLEDTLSNKLNTEKLPKDDIIALPDYLNMVTNEMLNSIDFMSFLANDSMLSKNTKLQWLSYNKELLELEKDLTFYGGNEILAGVNDEALKKYKAEILPALTYIYDGQQWYKTSEEIKPITERALRKYEEVISNMATLVGNENVKTEVMESQFNNVIDEKAKQDEQAKLAEQVKQQEQAKLAEQVKQAEQSQLAKQAEVNASKEKLNALQQELDQKKLQAKEKFKPLETDEPDILWGKMLRFNSLKMYDMCIVCLNMYQQKVKSAEADTFIPIAIEFFKQIDTTRIDYGCMIGGYEPNKPINSAYKLGDVLIEVNNIKITTIDDFPAAKGEAVDGYAAKVLRYNGSSFSIVEVHTVPTDGRVLLYDMCEVIE